MTIGEDMLARDETGRLRTRIATVFPHSQTIVTLPGIHATQRLAYVDSINRKRIENGLGPLTEEQEDDAFSDAVDLVLDDDGTVLIRPDPENMELAFEADELLQQFVSKKRIKFLHVLNSQVRDAIKRRGERWRISPLPRSVDDMHRMITSSRIGIGGREIYYYNKTTGTRLLTCQEFCGLAKLNDTDLRLHLAEIAMHCHRCNRLGNNEVDFFMAGDPTLKDAVRDETLACGEPFALRDRFNALCERLCRCVPAEFHKDDIRSPEWRGQMFDALIGHTDKEVSEESLLGLSAEFFMQIEWLPGARIEEGELLLDPVFEEEANDGGPSEQHITDERARGFIFNFIRDFGDLEYVNIGRVPGSLSNREATAGCRGVYLAEVKQREAAKAVLRIIRMQKWGVREHLDEGKDLLASILEAEEYTQYILDRRLSCRQLGMNLTPRTVARKLSERYSGANRQYQGKWIYSTYFERDYVPGLATDKIAPCRLENDAFAIRLARVLGRAAASNLIVGRTNIQGKVIFDDGDEVVVEDQQGLPSEIVIADHTGTFGDYRRDLLDLAPAYATPINKRASALHDMNVFADAYLSAFVERFMHIQREYIKRKRAFDTLFKHLQRDEAGSLSYRWERVLQRLEGADPIKLADKIRQNIISH